ncbi:MAG: putative quinol monooxygenase [Bacteroidia bacterium]
MITRFVKMNFQEEKVSEFLALFQANKHKIAGFEGCKSLELLNDVNEPTIFFTYSIWEKEEYLSKYRDSLLFTEIWGKTKILFKAKPEAWSLKSCA